MGTPPRSGYARDRDGRFAILKRGHTGTDSPGSRRKAAGIYDAYTKTWKIGGARHKAPAYGRSSPTLRHTRVTSSE